MKRCARCGETKPVDEFPRNKGRRDGYHSYCKPCHRKQNHEALEKQGGSRRYHLKQRYGITEKQIEQLLRKQRYRCAICRRPAPTHLDHCHKTARTRGVLCVSCNNGLGLFSDDPARLRAAADYLQGGQ